MIGPALAALRRTDELGHAGCGGGLVHHRRDRGGVGQVPPRLVDPCLRIRLRATSSPWTSTGGSCRSLTIYHLQHGSTDLLTALHKGEVLVFDVLLQVFYCATALLLSLFIVGALIAIDPADVAGGDRVHRRVLPSRDAVLSRARLQANSQAFDRYIAQRVQIVQESVGGIRDIIIDGSKAQFVEAFAAADRRISQAHVSNALIGSAPRYVIEAASLMLVAALALYLVSRTGSGRRRADPRSARARCAAPASPCPASLHRLGDTVAGHWLVTTDVLKALSLPVADEPESLPAPLRLAR